MNEVIDFINTNRDRYVDELKEYLAIPSISALPRARGRRARAAPSGPPTRCARIGLQNVRLIETPGYPGRLRRLARRRGRADDPVLRPLRRAAGRSARAVGLAAVRGDRARRRDLRARLRRRQGPGLHALQGDRGAPEAERPPAGATSSSSSKAKRKSARANLDDFVKAHKDELAADVVVISDSPMFDRGIPSICYGLRGLVYFQIDLRGTKSRSALGLVRRRRGQPGVRARADPRADEGPQRPHQDPRLLRRRAGAERRGAGAVEASCRSTRRATRRSSARRSCSARRGYSHARARVGAADVRGQRPAVAASPAKAPRRCIPAVAMAKVSMRLVPNQDPDKIARAVRGLREEGCAEDRGGEGDAHARRQAVDDRVRQQVRAGRRPRDREGLRQGAGVQPRRRIDPGRRDVPGDPRAAVGALRRRPAGRERARAEREARSRQLPRRHHRVGVSLRRDRQRPGAEYRAERGQRRGW